MERLQIRGHRLGTVASPPVHALDVYRPSAVPSLVVFHRIYVLTQGAIRAECSRSKDPAGHWIGLSVTYLARNNNAIIKINRTSPHLIVRQTTSDPPSQYFTLRSPLGGLAFEG